MTWPEDDALEQDAPPRQALDSPGLPAGFRRGVALGLFSSRPQEHEQRQDYALLLDEIVAVGATDLAVVTRWSQRDVRASRIAPLAGLTPSDELLLWVMRRARALGLRVFLLPTLHLQERAQGDWRGKLRPDDPDAWWASYEAFVTHHARQAQLARAHMMAVGSELLSLERERSRWLRVIAKARDAFSGQLTYSANWDHFEVVSFWDKLDVVGMTGYQELSHEPWPSQEQLRAGFDPLRQRLRLWADEHERRYMFTEIGFPSHAQGCARPWDYTSQAPAAPELQARCLQALFEVWHQDKRLEGVYIWNWFGPRDPEDRGYSLRGKPAEDVLRRWYRGPSQE